MLKRLALAVIGAYQRWISPNKGYGCAYRIHCGGAGCSGLGFRAIRWRGLVPGLAILRMRLARCSAVHRAHHPRPRRLHRQAGVCDGCDGCDASGCDMPSCKGAKLCDLGDACECCDCLDLFDRKDHRGASDRDQRRRRKDEKRSVR